MHHTLMHPDVEQFFGPESQKAWSRKSKIMVTVTNLVGLKSGGHA